MGPKRWALIWCLHHIAGVVFAHFDLNDILSVRLMPMSWLMLDNHSKSHVASSFGNDEHQRNGTLNLAQARHDGSSFDIAYSTMGFHRKMIKEYMCSNFLASNILHEVAPAQFQSRVGLASYTNGSMDPAASNTLIDAMKFDQGSSGYKDWLSKTTTLDDIYRHYNPSQSNDNPLGNLANHRTVSSRRQDKPVHEDYEEGDITGYAMPQQSDNLGGLYPQQSLHINHHHHQGFDVHPTAGSKAEYPYLPNAGSAFPYDHSDGPSVFYDPIEGPPHAPPAFSLKKKLLDLLNPFKIFSLPSHPKPHLGYEYGGDSHESHSSSKEMGLKDLFDIALTTLAFLSFGMFILQVLMCVTMSKSDNSNMMMLPMEEIPDDGTAETFRTRRSTTTGSRYVLSLATMNELTKTVLTSIDAVQMAHTDSGKCLRHVQCESNKMSRGLENSQKIWIPIWNLGLSWLSSRVIQSQPKTSSILESLKASVFGLGKADCARMYSCSKNYIINHAK